MMREVHLLKERISRAPTNRRGYRQYGRKLRREILEHAARRVAQGDSYKEVARELGLADATLLNWCKDSSVKPVSKKHPVGFRPVEVRDEFSDGTGPSMKGREDCKPVSRPIVVLSSGVRVEGISIDELPSFLKRLGCS